MEPLLIVAIWIVCGVTTLLIAQGRGVTNTASWFLVGVLLGPFGVILAAIGARPSKSANRQSAMATLSQLAQLRADGVLSSEEYESRKRELLGGA